MQEKARVVEIIGDVISVLPVDIDVCVGCSNDECKDNGHLFEVSNPNGFDIKVGTEVRIGAAFKNQLVQALVSIGVPVAVAAAVFIMVPGLLPGSGEGAQVGFSLLFLVLTALVVFRLAKRIPQALPEITGVIEGTVMDEDSFDTTAFATEGYDPDTEYGKDTK